MFGRRERDKQELIQFLVALRNEIHALREDLLRDRQSTDEKRDPDAMSEGEVMGKWYLGENGDGI